jgi:hypothetical protein
MGTLGKIDRIGNNSICGFGIVVQSGRELVHVWVMGSIIKWQHWRAAGNVRSPGTARRNILAKCQTAEIESIQSKFRVII